MEKYTENYRTSYNNLLQKEILWILPEIKKL